MEILPIPKPVRPMPVCTGSTRSDPSRIPGDVAAIRQILGSDHPVAVTVPLSGFSEEPFYSDGALRLPLVATTPSDHHTMVLVGCRAAPAEPWRCSLSGAEQPGAGLGRSGTGTMARFSVEYIQSLAEEAWTGTV